MGSAQMILYLHGLNSSGASQKAGRIRTVLAPIEVLSPSYPAHKPRAALQYLQHWLRRLEGERDTSEPWMWIGSSLGGFYARYLTRFFPSAHLVLINPALRPWELFEPYRGESMISSSGSEYRVGDDLIEGTRPFSVVEDEGSPPTTLLLDAGDELIDWRIAAEVYAKRGRLFVFPGGDHAFAHLNEALPIILETYRSLE